MIKHVRKKRGSPEVVSNSWVKSQRIFLIEVVTTNWKLLLQALLIIGAVFWIFSPVLHGDWLWDDDFYVTANPLLNDPARLWKAWFEPGSFIEYYPIEQSVQWAQWQMWHTDTFGYHLTNVILHVCSSLLIWYLFNKLDLKWAWLGGLLFAIHPVQVESVAWISELKNTLSLPPFLLAMCAFIDYEENKKRRDYLLALGFFLIAMLCKPTMVMFPVVLLLYLWWKQDRIKWSDLKVSTPFFTISLVLGITAILIGNWYTQSQGDLSSDSVPLGGVFSRLACAGSTLSFYFSKFFLPIELLPIYPQWTVNPPSLLQFLPWLILGGVIYWLWTKRHDWGRHALMGLGFFFISLMPFLGFNAISYMWFTWVMDHFLYIPTIGLIGLVVAGLSQINNSLSSSLRLCSIGIIVIAMLLLALKSHSYAEKFINEETLWTYTFQLNPQALPANDLGAALLQKGQVTEAIEQFEYALRIKPNYAEAHNNLGNALIGMGRLSEAMDHYNQALQIKPNYAEARNNLGCVFFKTGQFFGAIEQYRRALQINPDYVDAHDNLGTSFLQTGDASEATEQFKAALRINPNDTEAQNNLMWLQKK